MRLESKLNDQSVLAELGKRLAQVRLAKNLTQAELAQQAGIGHRTLQRLEAGTVASQLSAFVRVCRALGLLERLDSLFPEATVSPLAQLKNAESMRRRASRASPAHSERRKWEWGDTP